MKLQVVLGSTRPGRVSERAAQWVVREAKKRDDITVELLDLNDYDLPFFDEAVSPRYNPERKTNAVGKKWLSKLSEGDAYVFVTPEYNHSIAGVLKNAIDYVDWQLHKKPSAIVSHGSVGGARAAVQLKEILSESRAIVIPQAVALIGASMSLDEEGILSDELKAQPYGPDTALNNMLDELIWYGKVLKEAREK